MSDPKSERLLNYANFRAWLEEISHKKEKLFLATQKKKEYFNKYREAFREYNRLMKEEEDIRTDLINHIPKRF